jgi:hypothetical protein
MTAQQRRPGGDSEAAVVSWAADKTRVRPLAASALVRAEVGRILARVDMEAIPLRAVQEAWSSALACTWSRRAELLEWARPRESDWKGGSSPAEIAERDRRLADQAAACRAKATLLELGLLDEFEVIPDVVHR